MSSRDLIDAQFDRAVEIVQGLPKTGPIQTDYEEKLTILYKQATVGNVKSPRPGMWDMLGRAKWDAWDKHKDLDSYEAKWLYVDALLKVLRKYSDKTIAKNLVQELESYNGDPSHIIMSRTFTQSSPSESSGSTVSEDEHRSQYLHAGQSRSFQNQPQNIPLQEETDSGSEEEGEDEDEARELPPPSQLLDPMSSSNVNARPQSSMSSHRYRTPLAGSLASPPPAHTQGIHPIPHIQPLPGFETPSAFAEPSPTSIPSSLYPESSRGMDSPSMAMPMYGPHPYRSQSQSLPMGQYGVVRPASSLALERALESMQAQLAAFNERLETLESNSPAASRTRLSGGNTPGRASPDDRGSIEWDTDDLGLWSFLVNPTLRTVQLLRNIAQFFAKNESNRSPSMIVLRRLCLDASFLLCFLALFRMIWRKSGVRRREVNAALVVLWRALLGRRERLLVDRGV
uniref:ACB domain-containing protein n=1 Tax=Moniliophthora roreri TaxID=221103 RepID=A0A0W0FL07_MONRR